MIEFIVQEPIVAKEEFHVFDSVEKKIILEGFEGYDLNRYVAIVDEPSLIIPLVHRVVALLDMRATYFVYWGKSQRIRAMVAANTRKGFGAEIVDGVRSIFAQKEFGPDVEFWPPLSSFPVDRGDFIWLSEDGRFDRSFFEYICSYCDDMVGWFNFVPSDVLYALAEKKGGFVYLSEDHRSRRQIVIVTSHRLDVDSLKIEFVDRKGYGGFYG